MRNIKSVASQAMPCALAAFAVALGTPAPAYAASAFDILIPKPAEFIPALIAFLVIWIILAKLVWPSVIKQLDARQQTIQDNLDAAEQAKVDAERALRTAEEKIDDAQREADKIISDAKADAETSKAQIIAKANEDAKKVVVKAHETVEHEREAALSDLTNQVADLSVDLASKIIGENLDVETQRRIIERYLAQAGDVDGDE
jgi:F-type H+-transporting ATPase subunit b